MRSASIALAALVLLGAAPASGDAGAIDVRFALVEARSPLTLCRGIASGKWLILNWHCLADLRAVLVSGKRIMVSRGGVETDLPADAIAQPLPSALKVAESAGLDFTLIASPLPPAVVLRPAPVAVHPGDRVELRQDGVPVATCRVSKICGSRVHYRACTVTPVRGWSGSSVWLTDTAPQLIGIHKDGPQYTNAGSARLLPAILGRSSILSPSDSAFAENFARNGRYRFVRAATLPDRCEQAAAAIDVQPFITRGKRTIVGMARLGERDILTADIDNGQICLFRWPSAAAVKCWDNPDPLNHRVNAIHPLGEGLLALAKSNDSTVGNDGSLRFLRLDPKQPIAGDAGEITAPIGSAVGLVETGGDLVAIVREMAVAFARRWRRSRQLCRHPFGRGLSRRLFLHPSQSDGATSLSRGPDRQGWSQRDSRSFGCGLARLLFLAITFRLFLLFLPAKDRMGPASRSASDALRRSESL